jgi:hypothetical protein
MPPSSTLSAPFVHREFNGELLLEELRDLRGAGVGLKHLFDCSQAMKELRGLPLADALVRIKQIASGRFQAQPELAGLMVRWSAKLRSERDVTELVLHFQRMAATSALLGAMLRGSGRLPPRGGRR